MAFQFPSNPSIGDTYLHYTWNGQAWVPAAADAPVTSVAGKTGAVQLQKSDISDFADADYATAGQGTLADTATQPSDNISTLTNDAGYITAAQVPPDAVNSVAGKTGNVTLVKADITDFSDADYASAAQGLLANTSVQPSDNISSLTNDSGYITSYTVTQNDVTSHQAALSITESQISDLGTYASLTGGKISASALPDIAISEYKGAVANQAAMLSVSGEKGDWVTRTDEGKVYVITGNDPSVIGGWTALVYPVAPSTDLNYATGTTTGVVSSSTGTDATIPAATTSTAGLMTDADKTKLDGIAAGAQVNTVDSVAGKTGAVTLVKADVTDFNDADYATSAQGALADSAVQPNDNVSTLTNDAGYITSAQAPGTDLSYTAATRELASSTGSNVILPEAVAGATAGLFSSADKSKLDGIAAGAQANTVDSVAGKTGAVSLVKADVTDFSDADYATAAQGALADSAIQSGDNISTLTNDAAYITSAGAPVQSVAGRTGNVTLAKADITDFSDADYATAAQGALADTATQPSDNVSTLTNDAGYITTAPSVLDDLTDVDTTTTAPTSGQALAYDGTNWGPADIQASDVIASYILESKSEIEATEGVVTYVDNYNTLFGYYRGYGASDGTNYYVAQVGYSVSDDAFSGQPAENYVSVYAQDGTYVTKRPLYNLDGGSMSANVALYGVYVDSNGHMAYGDGNTHSRVLIQTGINGYSYPYSQATDPEYFLRATLSSSASYLVNSSNSGFGKHINLQTDRIYIGFEGTNSSYQGGILWCDRDGTYLGQLRASDGHTDDRFGNQIGVNSTNLAVGSYYHDTNGNNLAGAVYWYTRDGANEVKLTSPSPVAGGLYGRRLVLTENRLYISETGSATRYIHIYDVSSGTPSLISSVASTNYDDGANWGYSMHANDDRLIVSGASTPTNFHVFNNYGGHLASINTGNVAFDAGINSNLYTTPTGFFVTQDSGRRGAGYSFEGADTAGKYPSISNGELSPGYILTGFKHDATTATTTVNNNFTVGGNLTVTGTTTTSNTNTSLTVTGPFVANDVTQMTITGTFQANNSITVSQDVTANNYYSGTQRFRGDTSDNIAIGRQAFNSNSSSDSSVIIGALAADAASAVNNTVVIGHNAAGVATTGGQSVVLGSEALAASPGMPAAVVLGYQAASTMTTTPTQLIAIGGNAASSPSVGLNTIAVGYGAMGGGFAIPGDYNIAIGYNSMSRCEAPSTGYNVAIGGEAMKYVTTSRSVAVGYQAGLGLQGNDNTAIGYQALALTTTGDKNTAIGMSAGRSINTGVDNTCVGYAAGYTLDSCSNNVAIGRNALAQNVLGNSNTAVGTAALNACLGGVNIGIGRSAGISITTGNGNIVIGGHGGSGSFKPVIEPTTESDLISLGSREVARSYMHTGWTTTGDQRDQTNHTTVPHGLSFINQLTPYSYQYSSDRTTPTAYGPVRYGFKAQDILTLEGGSPVVVDNTDTSKLGFNADSLQAIIVKALQDITNPPVYANNAAAKTGGLVDGDIYRTSDGTLKVVFT